MSTITTQASTPQQPSIYDDAVEFGQFKTSIMFYVLLVFGILLICFGIYNMFFKKNNHTQEVSSTVRNVKCDSIWDRYNENFLCTFNITYTYEGKTYQPDNKITISNNMPLHESDPYTVYVDPINPSDFSHDGLKTDHGTGVVMVFLGLFLIGIGYFTRWLSYRYRSYAALETVSTGASMIGAFNNRW